MKTKTLLIAAVMFFGLTAAAFAQATFSVGSIPVTAVVNTGQVELSGALTFTLVSGTSVAGTVSASYGVPITSPFSSVSITQGTTLVGCVIGGFTVNTTASSNSGGLLVINVPGSCTAGSVSVSGVRVAVAGTTLTSLSASLSTTGNAITAGQTSVTVISSIAAGIASVKVATAGTINANTGAVGGSPVSIAIKEGFLNAWGQGATSTLAGIRITLSAAPPAGVTFAFPATATTNGTGIPQFSTCNSDMSGCSSTTNIGIVTISSTSSSLAVYYKAVSDTDSTTQETLTIPVTVAVDTNVVTLPISATSFTVVASMAPIGTAFATDGVTPLTTPIPRYAALDVGPATLVNVTLNNTVMLFPFVQSVGALGYNTGFSIANTTLDPGSTAMGFGSSTAAIAQSGTIKFYFYPSMPASGTLPASFTYTTTAGSPGSGLDSSGRVVAGSTYTVLVTQLLAAAGQTSTDFNGYVFAICNFSNGHGFSVVSNFTTFSESTLGLVVGQSRRVTPEALNN